jgi:hypothetical protein
MERQNLKRNKKSTANPAKNFKTFTPRNGIMCQPLVPEFNESDSKCENDGFKFIYTPK